MSARSLLNRLLGPKASAYVLHLRPMEWPIMTAHFLLGTFLAQGWGLPPGRTLLGWLAYVVCLNGATLAINSAFDQDQGDIGYLKDPPKPPKHLLAFSLALHALGLGCALPFLWMIFGKQLGDPNGPICALMVALYITQDSFGTACNVSGDNAIAVVIDKVYKTWIEK